MKYALNLSLDNRILSACVVLPRGIYNNMPIVSILPEGNISDYLYVDNEYVYEPLTKEDASEPTPTLEDRVSVLEKTVGITIAEYNEVLQELGVEA